MTQRSTPHLESALQARAITRTAPTTARRRAISALFLSAALAACSGNQSATSNTTLTTPTETPDASPSEPEATLDAAANTPLVDTADAAVLTQSNEQPSATVADATAPAVADASSRDASASAPRTTHSTTSTATHATSSTSATASPAVAEGRAVFDRTCGRCHPGGERRVGPRIAGRNDSEAHLRDVVRNGDGTMRPIPTSRLSDGDLAKVIVFLRSIRAVR